MKKTMVILVAILCIFTVYNVEAKTVRPNDIPASTYVIGQHMYTRNTSSTTGYDGKLTTGRIMLGARTIIGESIDDMIIYYKNLSGMWIDALTGEDISNILPTTFEIESTDLSGTGTINAPNYQTYGVNNTSIGASTYVIGSYIYTRNVFHSEYHENDGALTTKEIMLASKTIAGNSESDMKIYYKTLSGRWIDALTGTESTPPTVIQVAVVDLINQTDNDMVVNLIDGSSFNDKIKALAGNNDITKIQKAESINLNDITNDNLISDNESEVPVYAWFDNGTIYYYPVHYLDNVKIYLNPRSNSMFSGLNKVTSIDLSGFDTSKVINMSSMFADCYSLTSLNLSTFDTSSVTNMSNMFTNCVSLTSINLSGFDTSKVSNMNRMFFNCEKLTTLNLSSFVTSNVVDMKEMFAYSSKLTSLDLSSFNTSKVVSFEKMFQYCGELQTITLDKNKFDTSRSSNMARMFQYCEKLESVDVSGFDTSNVYDMSNMFSDCKKLLHIDVSNFNTSNVTNMSYMFINCLLVDELNVSNFDTSKVTDMSWMFFDCAKLETLDLSAFDLSSVTDSTYMIHALHSLKTIKMPKVYPTEPIEIDKILYDGDGTLYEGTTENIAPEKLLYNSTYLLSGEDFNVKIKNIAGNNYTDWISEDQNITRIVREDNVSNVPNNVIGNEDNIVSLPESYIPVYAWFNSGTLYYYSERDTIYLDYSASDMFYGLDSAQEIDFTGVSTIRTTDMSNMFAECSSLTILDLSGFDLTKVTSVSNMLYGADALTELVTPHTYGNNTITLPKTMYFEGSLTGYTELDSNNPTSTSVKNVVWGDGITLYNVISSTAIIPTNPINFDDVSSPSNGEGLYILPGTENDTNPIYYYRGAVNNNNVIFGDYCWQVVRTTDTGGIKMIYNGEVTGNGETCENTTGASRQLASTSSINSRAISMADAGYMKNEGYNIYIIEAGAEAEESIYGKNVEWDGSNYLVIEDTANVASTNTTKDKNHHYTCGTAGTTSCPSVRYYYYDDHFITLTDGEIVEDVIYRMTGNIVNPNIDVVTRNSGYVLNQNDSTIKTAIESWFRENLTNEVDNTKRNYVSYLEDTIFCNDRSFKTVSGDIYVPTYQESGWNPNGGLLSERLYFGTFNRFDNNWYSTTNVPSMACPNETDRFSVSSSVAHLNYPVGLLTADEIVLAGEILIQSNKSFYLYTGNGYWTMSPSTFGRNAVGALALDQNGFMSNMYTSESYGLRPVVSLKHGTEFVSGGDGTPTNPYVVKYE